MKKKWRHNITIAQFLHLPVDLIGTAAAAHKARAAQHINLKVGALFEGEALGAVESALAALILIRILALQPNVTYHNLHALLALDLGTGTLNLSSAEIGKLIFFSL